MLIPYTLDELEDITPKKSHTLLIYCHVIKQASGLIHLEYFLKIDHAGYVSHWKMEQQEANSRIFLKIQLILRSYKYNQYKKIYSNFINTN